MPARAIRQLLPREHIPIGISQIEKLERRTEKLSGRECIGPTIDKSEMDKQVSGSELPSEKEIEEAHSRLAEGLKSCHTVVANYKAMIAKDSDKAARPDQEPESNL